VGLAAAAVLGVAGLAVAVLAHRRGETLLGVTVCGLISAAAAPFAWSHHFVWFGPLLVLLAHGAAGGDRRAAVALAGVLAVTLAFVTRLPGPAVGPIPSTGLISLRPDVYLAAVIVTVAVAARSLVMRAHAS
jgi:alpha-1,2-mannosyltransferase